jgi:signal transduction histidine kinase
MNEQKTAGVHAERSRGAKANSTQVYVPTVSIITKKEDNTLQIMVKDNGNGMPKEIVDKIFQPFFTTKPTGQGTGLGLSMSYDIVKKGHGGELLVETEEGEGSTFSIELPTKQ